MPGVTGKVARWCLSKVLDDVWVPVKGASLANDTRPVWQDTIEVGRGAGKGVFAVLGWIGEPRSSVLKDTFLGRRIITIANWVDKNQRRANAEFLRDFGPFLRKIDPQGRLLGELERVEDHYNPALEDEVWAYFRNKIKANQLSAEAQPAIRLKAEFVARMNKIPELRKLPRGKHQWTTDEDITQALVKGLYDPKRPNATAYDLINVVGKHTFMKLLRGNLDDIRANEFIAVTMPQLVRKIEYDYGIDIIKDLSVGLKPHQKDYAKLLLSRMSGEKTGLQTKIDNLVGQFVADIGGKPMTISPSARMSMAMSRAFYLGTMAFSPGIALLNLTQVMNPLLKYGEGATLRGIQNFAKKEGRFLAGEREFLSDLHPYYIRSAKPGTLGSALETFGHWGYYMFDKAENFNRGLAFHIGLADYLKKSGIGTLEKFISLKSAAPKSHQYKQYMGGMAYAMKAANETQFLYSLVHQSPALSGPIAKLLFGQFTSFPIKQSEFLLREAAKNPQWFLGRWLAYTGAFAGLAHVGLGIEMGRELGGAGSVPMAIELGRDGRIWDASMTAMGGIFRYLPGGFAFTQGLTPAGSLLGDLLGLMYKDDPDVAWANLGRTLRTLIPGGVQAGKIIEAAIVAGEPNYERYIPGGPGRGAANLLEASAIPVAIERAVESVFGVGVIPGVEGRFTGSLARRETLTSLGKQVLGMRPSDVQWESELYQSRRSEEAAGRRDVQAVADNIVQAMLGNQPERLNAAYAEAGKSGLFPTSQSLHAAISAAYRRHTMPRIERQKIGLSKRTLKREWDRENG